MIALVKAQLKENRSTILFCLIVPIVLAFFLSLIMSGAIFYDAFFIVPIVAMLVFFMYAFLSLSSIYKDYHIHYGDHASFFSTLPLSPKEVLGARFLYYLSINALTLASFLGIVLLIYIFTISQVAIYEYLLFKNGMMGFLGDLNALDFFIGLFSLVLSLVHGIALTLFAVSLGGERPLRKLGIFGPVVVYIILQIFEAFLGFISNNFPWTYAIIAKGDQIFHKGFLNTPLSQLTKNFVEGKELLFHTSLLMWVFQIILLVFFLYRTYISHKKKMSVY